MSFRDEQQEIGKLIINYLINDAITTYTNYAIRAFGELHSGCQSLSMVWMGCLHHRQFNHCKLLPTSLKLCLGAHLFKCLQQPNYSLRDSTQNNMQYGLYSRDRELYLKNGLHFAVKNLKSTSLTRVRVDHHQHHWLWAAFDRALYHHHLLFHRRASI
jgi:hypothetical protein